MLRFFRQIRQRLLKDSKFSRYLLYAIGEILLVVVGILIALQVDTWRERKEMAAQEHYYLSRLEGELATNRSIAKELSDFKRFQNNNARLVLGMLNGSIPKDSADQSFFLALEHLTWLFRRDFRRDVWEELKSTGNIDLISDRELRTRLSHAYSAFDFYTGFEEEWAAYNTGYRRLLGDAQIFSLKTREALTRALSPGGVRGVVRDLPDLDATLVKLREIRPLRGYLSDIVLSSGTGMDSYTRIGKNIDSLLQDLKRIKATP